MLPLGPFPSTINSTITQSPNGPIIAPVAQPRKLWPQIGDTTCQYSEILAFPWPFSAIEHGGHRLLNAHDVTLSFLFSLIFTYSTRQQLPQYQFRSSTNIKPTALNNNKSSNHVEPTIRTRVRAGIQRYLQPVLHAAFFMQPPADLASQ